MTIIVNQIKISLIKMFPCHSRKFLIMVHTTVFSHLRKLIEKDICLESSLLSNRIGKTTLRKFCFLTPHETKVDNALQRRQRSIMETSSRGGEHCQNTILKTTMMTTIMTLMTMFSTCDDIDNDNK